MLFKKVILLKTSLEQTEIYQVYNFLINLKPRAVFDRETSRLEELQGSFIHPHTHRCPGRARRYLAITITISDFANCGTDTIRYI